MSLDAASVLKLDYAFEAQPFVLIVPGRKTTDLDVLHDGAVFIVASHIEPYRPAGDVSISGWASTSEAHFEVLNEAVPNDANFVTSPPLDGPVSEVLELSAPLPAGTYTLRIRANVSDGEEGTLRVSALNDANESQGATGDQAIDATITTYSLPLTTTGIATRIKIEVE